MKKIIIDGYIGDYGYSKQYVRAMLTDAGKNEVELTVSSLGGSVAHAIDIHDQLAAHGNVHVVYTGMNASSATVISLGAKKISMSENSFYLIHKAMFWIDIFGTLNEDDIDATIADLQKQKNELAKITLVLARMYRDKTGMPITDVLSLMKEETWLTADQAKEKGFVDEIFKPSQAVNFLEDTRLVALIAANGYPVPGRKSQAPIPAPAPTTPPASQQFNEDSLINKLVSRFREIFKPSNTMNKQFLNVNKTIKVDSLECSDEGVFLNQQQMESIDSALAAAATAEQQRTDAVTARDTAVNERDAAVNAFDEIHPDVKAATTPEAKVAAIKAILATKPAAKPAGGASDEGDGGPSADGVDWDTLNSLSHMNSEL